MKTTSKFSLLSWVASSAILAASAADEPASWVEEKVDEVPACCAEPMPTVMAELPAESIYQLDFTFTDDSGAERQLSELRGQPTLMAMFFAQCGYACPLLVRDMKDVVGRLPADIAKNVRILLVTFDTDRDSVEALHAYRKTNELDERWELWRASPSDTRTYAMVVGVQFRQEPSGDYSHSNLITLLDSDGVIAHRRTGLQGGLEGLTEATVRYVESAP